MSADGPRAAAARLAWLRALPLPASFVKALIVRREVRIAAREGRLGHGTAIADAYSVSEVPSVARLGTADRVLADVDQDGFLFARDPADVALFNRRSEKLPRRRDRLSVVLRGGAVCLRKAFASHASRVSPKSILWTALGLPFYTSVAAALRLSRVPCGGNVREIDLRTRTIYWDLVRAEDLRQWLGRRTPLVHDLDLGRDPALRNLDSDSRDRREIALFTAAGGARYGAAIREAVRAMNAAGVAVLDVKLGNVLVGEITGQVYWVDLEWAQIASWPGWDAALGFQDHELERWFSATPLPTARG